MSTSLADWLQGWGTVAGSIFSAIAAVTALALYWREVNNRQKDNEEQNTRQARNVLVTILTPSQPTHLEDIEIVAYNFTSEVVLNFCYRVHRRDSGVEVKSYSSDIFPPSSKDEPGPRRTVKLNPVMPCDKPEDPVSLFALNYWFTDARNYNWHRVDHGPPVRISGLPSEEWKTFEWFSGQAKEGSY